MEQLGLMLRKQKQRDGPALKVQVYYLMRRSSKKKLALNDNAIIMRNFLCPHLGDKPIIMSEFLMPVFRWRG